jgi:hypothetical protein
MGNINFNFWFNKLARKLRQLIPDMILEQGKFLFEFREKTTIIQCITDAQIREAEEKALYEQFYWEAIVEATVLKNAVVYETVEY